MSVPRQLALALAHTESFAREDFLSGPSNASALALVESWPDWPGRAAVLVGPEGSGKSHLAAIWAGEAGARFVANPGCYPTATLLAVLPLAQFEVSQIIVDAKSGITGAGRKPSVRALYAEVAGDIHAYGLEGHRHEAEIMQELNAAGIDVPLVFTPHVVPLARGMLVDAYVVMRSAPDASAVRATYARFYAGNPFVRLLDEGVSPSVAAVAYTNDAEISVSVHGNVVRAICAIDNLGKGAATQAVMNLNIMLGFPEETALRQGALTARRSG